MSNYNALLFIILPSVGITSIYFLRKYLFKNRKNKGITEIYNTLDKRKDHLPLFKIPSHFINGFLTVIFGGSTGVEVSTVVATATVGNLAYKKQFSAMKYKRELICAAVTAGVAVLFASPLAGLLFAVEVIARKLRKTILISSIISAAVAWGFIQVFEHEPFFNIPVVGWQWKAVPFFLLLSLFAGALSVYFTLLVIKTKALFTKLPNYFLRVNIGALAVGVMIFFLPMLFGDSYHGLHSVLHTMLLHKEYSILVLFLLVVLKPLASSLTLGAGGDGGVFAPSIVTGAFLGLLVAYCSNVFFGTNLVLFNFMLIGAACTLAGAISAPMTSFVLVCSLAPNGYALIIPLAVCCYVAKYFAQWILPYNVYTYESHKALNLATSKA
ncbi:chloride channel protein [Sphingobacterium oryzagri]|uniref:Chloride channel protein n=1 Tax=Sphingobacterium oryzagri TaxID=3025669 RepID=A0ABY7WE36_9SPHI|nr:chloride channel protein [Sphingobacterium sp. KACC 22765]WDF66776.1 chloride channel protein [Sphingobacterium sp. KACC 22765]